MSSQEQLDPIIPHIPQEIYDIIIDQANPHRSTLYNLCLVSSSFLPQAQRTLYQNLNISDDGFALCSGWLIDATRAMSLFRTLTEHNPALAKYVHSLYHRLASHHDSPDSLYWNLFRQALRRLTNLKRLTITCINPVLDLYTGCSFRLEVFGSDRACDEPVVQEAILQHLAAQPNLRSLYAWKLFRHGEHLPLYLCPNLDALTGDRRTIEGILPGRSVSRLTWIPDSGEDTSSPPLSISAELSNIRILSLGGYYKRPSLRLVIPYLPSLQVLRLFGETRELDLLDELALIADFSNIRTFIWTAGFATSVKWVYFGDFGDKAGVEAQRRLVNGWFLRSRTLETAYFQAHKPRLEPQCYFRWRRGEDEPVEVGYTEAIESHGVVSWYS
ncbi:hypothetical protein D9756_007351 [Leucocoprinus leucothites]|uniref:Uncharacterized protein n=1 Tax=Leucocoprinus leucothites TaxID=201217 RepID=A0A8H5D5Q9_9AGAR|nr:hypothetical protein D9756_007351 [Leucoagaricus leucothites]